ncbi:ketosamine-3-kinase-like [Rhodnius prolixus]|uniref:ketosamine-3-kinase-like n=1 Tax=Rhodnius prolixus TaxID=13249 RepID=UPI003D189F66
MQSHSPCPMATPNMKMETLLKTALNTSTLVRTGQSGGGCINQGEAYITDNGTVFVKSNGRPQARIMFEGEMEGLKALGATGIVTVPRPISVLDNPDGGACLVMEFIEMKGLRSLSQKLGEDLAKMHMQNVLLENKSNRITDKVQMDYVPNFGFHTVTCCGYIPQENEWNEDWVAFFSQNRLDYQFRLLEKEKGDRDSIEMWSRLQIILPKFFKDQKIRPSLLHGDFWSGNVAQTKRHPVLFDPAAFYGHHEYDLATAGMFGTFSKSFYDAYHKIIPKASGFEGRHRLYTLFHYLNHWNHFGDGYKGSAMAVMRSLLK